MIQDSIKNKSFVVDFKKIADIHADRLKASHDEALKFMPLTASKFAELTTLQDAFLDMMTTRFSKLQDIIGARIFPLILEILGEDAATFIDKLNKLEKLDYISDVDWWMELRELRNQITHDYPDDYEILSKHFCALITSVHELLVFWGELKLKIDLLTK